MLACKASKSAVTESEHWYLCVGTWGADVAVAGFQINIYALLD
jgi:hypothetical protein